MFSYNIYLIFNETIFTLLLYKPNYVMDCKIKYKKLIVYNNKNRFYSTKALSFSNYNLPIIYNNADREKLKILEEVKNKSGIYMWTNKKNVKPYIGSSTFTKVGGGTTLQVGSSMNLKRRYLDYIII